MEQGQCTYRAQLANEKSELTAILDLFFLLLISSDLHQEKVLLESLNIPIINNILIFFDGKKFTAGSVNLFPIFDHVTCP